MSVTRPRCTITGMIHDMSRAATPEELADILNSPKYGPWVLAEYEYWTLRLNIDNQGLPGRSYAWLKQRHVDRMSLTDLTEDELHELMLVIVPEFESVMKEWLPLLTINFEWLGNETHHHRGHGHAHLTPRLSEPFTFSGREFIDVDPNGRNKNEKLVLPQEELNVLYETVRSMFGRT